MTNPANLQIVKAGPVHMAQLLPLFEGYLRFYEVTADSERARAYLAARLERGESVVFLALAGEAETAVGFTQLYPTFSSLRMAPVWVLYDLYVDPAQRRQGIGRALMERAHQFARERGGASVSLATAKDNIPGQTLYESLGYARDDDFYYYDLDLD